MVSSTPPGSPRKAAVLGSPIAHSRSPQLHLAAYRALGLDGWTYDRIECTAEQLPVNPDGVPFPEHVSINFSAFGKGEVEKKAKVLTRQAQARGWLFQAELE